MKFRLTFLFLLLTAGPAFSQNTVPDYNWWNEQHDWQPGDPNWRYYIRMTPGYLGPNGLPVPEVKKGFNLQKSEFEISAAYHFHPGDPTQDISGRIFVPFAQGKIALELYGVILEHFAFSEEIRNERFARIENGKGTAVGDFYFSTLVQLIKDKKFPNTLLRLAAKTTSGALDAARYSDSPGYFFDLSFSKDIGATESGVFRPFGSAGFYSWQTNDDVNLQNDAYMYALGAEYSKNFWLFSGSLSGYSGYKNERDKPQQLNFELRRDWDKKAFRIQYIYGMRDWTYKTIKCSFIWKLNGVK